MRIEGGVVVTMDADRRVLPDATVVIEGSRITGIEPADSRTSSSGDQVIDARGMAVLPGLVNAHTHIGSNILARGLLDDLVLFDWLETLRRLKANFSSEDLFSASLVGIAEMLLSGTTCFNEMFDGYDPRPGLAAAEEAGIRMVAGWCFADMGVYEGEGDRSWNDLSHIDSIKARHHESVDGRILLAIAPHAPYTVSRPLARACREAATQTGLRLHTHLAEQDQETVVIQERYGQTPVQYFADAGLLGPDLVAAHCCQLMPADLELLATTGTAVAHCPICNTRRVKGYFPYPRARASGIPVGLGTDGPASNNSLDLFAEAKFAVSLHNHMAKDIRAMTAREALALATISSARALGLDSTIGSLEAGKRADIVLVDLMQPGCAPIHDIYSSLVYTSAGSNVDTVVVDGRILVRHGKMVRLRIGELVQDLQDRAASLARRSLGH